jgi:hypothetical protein
LKKENEMVKPITASQYIEMFPVDQLELSLEEEEALTEILPHIQQFKEEQHYVFSLVECNWIAPENQEGSHQIVHSLWTKSKDFVDQQINGRGYEERMSLLRQRKMLRERAAMLSQDLGIRSVFGAMELACLLRKASEMR